MRRFLAVLMLAACRDTGTDTDTTTDTDTDTDTGTTDTDTTPVAGGPAFDELAFFQAVRVPVLLGEQEVAPSARNAPLIADRQGVLRALVTTPSDWTGGTLELAVDLTSGGGTETFTTSGDGTGPLVVDLPASAMDADATYTVRLSSGGAVVDRFPDTGEAELDARVTGPLKVRLVPFEVNGFVPDTSAAVVEGYRAALMAVYPVTEVQISVDEVQVWDGAYDLGDINVQVGVIQEDAMFAGQVGWDVYYYGMVTGVATRDEYEGITGTSEGGGGDPTRAYFAAGAAFGDQKSEDTLIHEIGHTHQLPHAPCDGENDPDPDYPYAGGGIGVEGWDLRTGTFVSSDAAFDMMTYCFPRWISDYNYAKLADHVARAQTYPDLHDE